MVRRITALLPVLFLLFGCAELPAPRPTPAPTLAQAMTPTSVPTATTTPTPSPTATPTQLPSPTTDAATGLLANHPLRILSVIVAPDELRRAEVLTTGCIEAGESAVDPVFELIRIVDLHGQTETQLDARLWECRESVPWGFDGRVWSPSGRYFYYSTERQGQAKTCGPTSPFIVRVDTSDWTQTFLGEATFAPDGATLAVWRDGTLLIQTIEGEEIAALPPVVPFAESSPPVWSPDGASLIYLQAHSFCDAGLSAVVQVDTMTAESRVLLETNGAPYVAVTWDEAGQLRLEDGDGVLWLLDPATGSVSVAE